MKIKLANRLVDSENCINKNFYGNRVVFWLAIGQSMFVGEGYHTVHIARVTGSGNCRNGGGRHMPAMSESPQSRCGEWRRFTVRSSQYFSVVDQSMDRLVRLN
jgi:hypothetical protein